jgi:hypothetical protein
MALLLRMGGVPARVASGFSPGGYSKRYAAWIVRDTDAHAWVEAWFDNTGWVTYDPTPDATPARSQIAALVAPPPPAPPPPPSVGAGGGAAEGRRAGGLRPDLRFDPLRRSASASSGQLDGGGTPWWEWGLGAVLVLALGLPAAAAVAVRLRRRGEPLPPLERAVAELQEALRRAGRPAPPSTTLQQLERRLGGSTEAASYLRALSAARYGATSAPPTAAQRRALRRALAEGLGVTGRVRAWWALPPRL